MISVIGRRRGFTLIELIIIIVIVGILAGVTLPQMRAGLRAWALESFSRSFQSTLNFLTQQAVAEGKVLCLHIDNEHKTYWAAYVGNETHVRTASIGRDLTINVTTAEEAQGVCFYPDGSVDKADIVIYTSDNQTIALTSQGVFGGFKVKK